MMIGRSAWLLLVLGSSAGCGAHKLDPEVAHVREEQGERAPDKQHALRLRALGPKGLIQALAQYDAADRSDDVNGWETFVDTVAAARDTSAARLFWETDLERAKESSRDTGRPILSLRLLGDLRDELSCANSRFFRTILYADPEVSRRLRDNFVLHWSSERPVPVVEITFGDGRALKTTTTGNSIHYLLDADGQVVDGLPGLYTPAGFARALDEMKALAAKDFAKVRSSYAQANFGADADDRPSKLATAIRAQSLTVSKAMVELPILQAIGPEHASAAQAVSEFEILQPAQLSETSIALIRRDRPHRPGESDAEHGARISLILERLAASVARDQLKNESDVRPTLRRWLAEPSANRELEAFNTRVYRDLFQTPASDPWLGLLDDATYDGVSDAGIVRVPG